MRPAAGRVVLRAPSARDVGALVALARASRALHRPWVYLPETAAGWKPYFERCRSGAVLGHLVILRTTGALAGVVNVSEVVRGAFRSAYLGFYAHADHAGQGLMREGLAEVLRVAFRKHGLHRLEANIQPGNAASRKLVRTLGFRREGFSPRYLKIGGRWRDHERWALTREDWRERPSREPRGRSAV